MEHVVYVDRRNTNCYKWDSLEKSYGKEGLLPLSIADMDFQTPQCVREALKAYVDMGAIGYNMPSDAYYNSFLKWEECYHQNPIEREWVRFAPGVVTAIAWLLKIWTHPGDTGIILTPVYGPFSDMLKRWGVEPVCSPLKLERGRYVIDFDDFEEKIVLSQVRIFLLCSPHNPVGRVWTEEELTRLVEICKKHGVYILSDEIHHDVLLFGHTHTSLLKVGAKVNYTNHIAMFTSAAKSFNLAGIENAFIVLPDEKAREQLDELQRSIAMRSGNALGYVAVTAAYSAGRPWLEEICRVIEGNYTYVRQTLLRELPQLVIPPMEGTFLMWIDFDAYCCPGEDVQKRMVEECKIVVNSGQAFGGERYRSWVRVNLATSRENLERATKCIVDVFCRQ